MQSHVYSARSSTQNRASTDMGTPPSRKKILTRSLKREAIPETELRMSSPYSKIPGTRLDSIVNLAEATLTQIMQPRCTKHQNAPNSSSSRPCCHTSRSPSRSSSLPVSVATAHRTSRFIFLGNLSPVGMFPSTTAKKIK